MLKVEQELNDYQFAFDISLAEKIQSEVDEIITSKKKLEIKPAFEPKPLSTTDQIFNETIKKNEEFIKTSLEIRDEEMKAENEIADEKAKKIIKDIVNPVPGLFINDTFNLQEDVSVNKPKNTDNTFRLKTQIQKN